MQKIILSDKTLAIIVQRLKHFYKGVVEQHYYDSTSVNIYAGEVKVDRWKAQHGRPAGYAVKTDFAYIHPGRTFYFIGNRTIVVAADPGEWGGLGRVKLTLVSSWKRMTDDQFGKAVIEHGDRMMEEAREEYYDQMRMDEAADRAIEASYRYGR